MYYHETRYKAARVSTPYLYFGRDILERKSVLVKSVSVRESVVYDVLDSYMKMICSCEDVCFKDISVKLYELRLSFLYPLLNLKDTI